jgi:hypothetical protein
MPEGLIGFGAHLLKPPQFQTWEQQEKRNREMLSHVLNLRDTIVFVGAGCPAALGHPTWKQLATFVIKMTQEELSDNSKKLEESLRNNCESRLAEFSKILQLPKCPATSLLFVLGSCENIWEGVFGDTRKTNRGAQQFRERVAKYVARPSKPSLANPYEHLLRLPATRFITSNYDFSLEEAIIRRRNLDRSEYIPSHCCPGKLLP